MSKDIRTDHEYQVAEFGDFGFRLLESTGSQEGESFSSIMALTDCSIDIISSRRGDGSRNINLKAGMVIYGDLIVDGLSGDVIAYLRGE